MKKFYFAVAASLVLCVSCFASSISLGSERPGEAGASPSRHAPSHDIRSAKEVSSELTESFSDLDRGSADCDAHGGLGCSGLTEATKVLSQKPTSIPLTSPASPAGLPSGIDTDDLDVESDLGKNATPTAEPSSLLFLAVGLLILPFLRKNRAA